MKSPVNKPHLWIGGWALVLLATVASAQKPKVEHFTVDHGLPSSAIFDLDQDASGRLWIVSRGGISVYDGRSFDHLEGEGGPPRRDLRALEIDDGGRIWVATRTLEGIYFLEDAAWHFLPKSPADSHQDPVTSIAVAGGGDSANVFLGTMTDGLWVWADGAWSALGVADGLPSDRVHDVTLHKGRVVAATDAGVCRVDGLELDCRIQAADARLGGSILGVDSIAGDDGPELWLLGPTWVGQLENGELSVAAEGFDMETVDPSISGAIGRDRAGGLYFGSSASSFYIDAEDGRLRQLGLRQGLAAEGANVLFTDRESNVWVGSLRGLSRIVSWRFESYDRDDGLLESEVSALAEMTDGTFVIGHNSGLTFFNGERFDAVPFNRPESPVFSHRVLDMAVDEEGTVWVAAQEMGLLRVSSGPGWTVALATERIRSVELDARANLWVASRDGLFHRQGSSFVSVDSGPREDSETYRWLHAADDGRLFIGGRGGLRWRDGDRWQVARGATFGSNNVFNVFAQSAETVWVGTGDGLHRLERDTLAKVRQGELSIDRPVFLIVRDPRGWMWFGTDGGVIVWDGHQARRLTAHHGLIGRETNRGAGWVDRQGRVWIGTDKGMSMYQHRYDTRSAEAPWVQVQAVEVDGVSWPIETGLELSHRQKNLTFHFDAVSLSQGRDLLYRHRLEGFDDGWQGPFPLSSGKVRYANLPPGDYHFNVAAGWDDGTWSREARSATITIARPFWRQPWFYALAAVAIGLGIPGVYQLRTRAIRARNAELETLNRQLSTHIEEKVSLISELEVKNEELERFSYTVSHDLKSPLVTIRGFVGYLKRHAAAGDIDRMGSDIARIENATQTMARLLDDLLELSRLGHVANEPEELSLGRLVHEAIELVSRQIADRGVAVEVGSNLPAVVVDRRQYLEVFQNLIENAVKFMGDQPSPRLEIGVRHDETQPVIFVRDNGIGIEPRFHGQIFGLFNRLDPTAQGTGVGLALVRRIVEVHGGRIWVESEGSGRGTSFCFTVPIARIGVRHPEDSETASRHTTTRD